MKIALAQTSEMKEATKPHADAILPLIPDKPKKLTKDECITFKLRTEPANNASPTYEFTMPYLYGTEPTRSSIRFMKDFEVVITGLNITTANGMLVMARRILKGEVLSQYNQMVENSNSVRWETLREQERQARINANDNEAAVLAGVAAINRPDYNEADHRQGVRAVIAYMTPYMGLKRQKRRTVEWSNRPGISAMSFRIRTDHSYNGTVVLTTPQDLTASTGHTRKCPKPIPILQEPTKCPNHGGECNTPYLYRTSIRTYAHSVTHDSRLDST